MFLQGLGWLVLLVMICILLMWLCSFFQGWMGRFLLRCLDCLCVDRFFIFCIMWFCQWCFSVMNSVMVVINLIEQMVRVVQMVYCMMVLNQFMFFLFLLFDGNMVMVVCGWVDVYQEMIEVFLVICYLAYLQEFMLLVGGLLFRCRLYGVFCFVYGVFDDCYFVCYYFCLF